MARTARIFRIDGVYSATIPFSAMNARIDACVKRQPSVRMMVKHRESAFAVELRLPSHQPSRGLRPD